MKINILTLLAAGFVLTSAAWFAQTPTEPGRGAVSEKQSDAAQKGLDYLARNQHKDGHWEGDDGAHPVAMTALVGLALVMEQKRSPWSRGASREVDAKHAAKVRRAADWLADRSEAGRDGLIFSGHASETSRYMQGHGLA